LKKTVKAEDFLNSIKSKKPTKQKVRKGENLLTVYPTVVKGRGGAGLKEGVAQYHFYENSYSLDFRFEHDDQNLVGWTVNVARKKSLSKVVNTLERAKGVAKAYSVNGDRWALPLADRRVTASPKETQHAAWLKSEGFVTGDGQKGVFNYKNDSLGILVKIQSLKVEYGLQTDHIHEYFLQDAGEFTGRLLFTKSKKDKDGWECELIDDLTPEVLKRGTPVPFGVSALPSSLEVEVPKSMKYWLAKEADERRALRDSLLDEGTLGTETIKIVNKYFRKVSVKWYVANTDPAEFDPCEETEPPVVEKQDPEKLIERIMEAVNPEEKDDYTVIDFRGQAVAKDRAVKEIDNLDVCHKFVLVDDLSTDSIKRFNKLGRPFQVTGDDDYVVVTSTAVKRPWRVDWIDKKVSVGEPTPPPQTWDLDAPRQTTASAFLGTIMKRDLPIFQNSSTADIEKEEERYVLGVVLEPEEEDAQGDIYSAEEVRQTAHKFMDEFRNIGYMHDKIVNKKVAILESFLSPEGFSINEKSVKKGTWLLGLRIKDDSLWTQIKSGEITGLSIGGSAIRSPE
jgi:hypothetical protein